MAAMGIATILNTPKTALLVDLEAVAGDGSGDLRIPAQMRLAPGDRIWVADPGADAYEAKILAVDGQRARILLDWSTQTELG
jgi:hypothetical protein